MFAPSHPHPHTRHSHCSPTAPVLFCPDVILCFRSKDELEIFENAFPKLYLVALEGKTNSLQISSQRYYVLFKIMSLRCQLQMVQYNACSDLLLRVPQNTSKRILNVSSADYPHAASSSNSMNVGIVITQSRFFVSSCLTARHVNWHRTQHIIFAGLCYFATNISYAQPLPSTHWS